MEGGGEEGESEGGGREGESEGEGRERESEGGGGEEEGYSGTGDGEEGSGESGIEAGRVEGVVGIGGVQELVSMLLGVKPKGISVFETEDGGVNPTTHEGGSLGELGYGSLRVAVGSRVAVLRKGQQNSTSKFQQLIERTSRTQWRSYCPGRRLDHRNR